MTILVTGASSGIGLADGGDHFDGAGSVVPDVVGLGRRLEQSQSAGPVMDSTTMRLPNIGPDAAQLEKAKAGMLAAGLL